MDRAPRYGKAQGDTDPGPPEASFQPPLAWIMAPSSDRPSLPSAPTEPLLHSAADFSRIKL